VQRNIGKWDIEVFTAREDTLKLFIQLFLQAFEHVFHVSSAENPTDTPIQNWAREAGHLTFPPRPKTTDKPTLQASLF
jgi:hypothetical protein